MSKENFLKVISNLSKYYREKKKWGETLSVQTDMGGTTPDLKVFGSLYQEVLNEVKNGTFYSDGRTQRKMLLDEVGVTLEELFKFGSIFIGDFYLLVIYDNPSPKYREKRKTTEKKPVTR